MTDTAVILGRALDRARDAWPTPPVDEAMAGYLELLALALAAEREPRYRAAFKAAIRRHPVVGLAVLGLREREVLGAYLPEALERMETPEAGRVRHGAAVAGTAAVGALAEAEAERVIASTC